MTRGIEIHGDYITVDKPFLDLPMGSVALPLTQRTAGQIVVTSVIDAIALGGDVNAGLFRVNITVSMIGSPVALSAVLIVEAGIAISGGFARGLYVGTDIENGASAEYGWDGIYISMYQHAGGVCGGNVAAITVRSNVGGTVGIYYFMYLQENASALMTGGFYIRVNDMSNLFYLFPTVTTAWAQTGNPANQNGWIKISLAGTERWIQLFSTAP